MKPFELRNATALYYFNIILINHSTSISKWKTYNPVLSFKIFWISKQVLFKRTCNPLLSHQQYFVTFWIVLWIGKKKKKRRLVIETINWLVALGTKPFGKGNTEIIPSTVPQNQVQPGHYFCRRFWIEVHLPLSMKPLIGR